jgi:hypothetical protein
MITGKITYIQQQKYSSLNNVFNNIFKKLFNKVLNNIKKTLDNLTIVGTFFLCFSVTTAAYYIPMLTINNKYKFRAHTRGGEYERIFDRAI